MDLIYADSNRVDLGVILDYALDLAYGKDENDFELELPIDKAVLNPNNYIYIEDTEYGGIIDTLNPSTKDQTIKYQGRTWHGILDNKILIPPKGQDYLTLDGEANLVLMQIIQMLNLTDLFEVSTEDSNIIINAYTVPRYAKAYQGVRNMLFNFGGKLNMIYHDGKVRLSVSPLVDFSREEEWDTSDFSMEIQKHFNPVNHLYCLGEGDLKDRHVIELFTDANGGIQPYALVATPTKDSDYILDNRNQQFIGLLDNSEVYDYRGAQTTENYDAVSVQPSFWNRNYVNYYQYDLMTNEYVQLERTYETTYEVLNTKPLDWNWNYSSYFYKDETGEYQSVDDSLIDTDSQYVELTGTEPPDWKTNYKNYYYYWTDGYTEEYRSVEGVKYNKYKKQTKKPSDWDSNKGNYYVKVKHYEYTYTVKKKIKGVWQKWEATYKQKIPTVNKKDYKITLKSSKLVKTEYVKISDLIKNPGSYIDKKPTPNIKLSDFKSWKNSEYRPFYTQISEEKAPQFGAGTKYYYLSESSSSPVWEAGKFYAQTDIEKIPTFIKNFFYEKVYDNYADLVANGIAKLEEYWNLDNVTIALNSEEQSYDIGDIVGATEPITNISITSQITKKIVTIEKNRINIEYGLGNDDTATEY
jgi:hypothetical protein